MRQSLRVFDSPLAAAPTSNCHLPSYNHTPPVAKTTSSTMPGHKPYYVEPGKFRVGDSGIIIPIESTLRVGPTVHEKQAVSNSQSNTSNTSVHCAQQLIFEQAMDDMDRGLPPRKIYPEPAAQGCYDTQGRLAGYIHGDEQVPQSEEEEKEVPTTTEEQQASETVDPKAVGPSTANEMMPPRRGGMQPQYPAMSATSSSGISRLVPQANAPNVYRQSLLRTNLDGQYSPPSQPEPATAANQTTQQQRGSKPSQKSATQTSDVLFPVLHAPETMMALHSGLPINVALSDLCHNAYPVDGQDPRYSIEYFGKCQDPYPLLDPELMATHASGTALHLDNSSAAGKVDRQQHDLTALPQKQHQQYQQQQYGPGPDTNALGVYDQGMQHGSSYGQHLLTSPSDPFNVAASQRDGSEAPPLQQHESKPDMSALGAYGQGMQHGSSYGQHPLPSPSDPFDVATSQRDGSEALPLQQHESKPDMSTPGVYGQGMQQGSLYGQNQSPLPSSSDPWADFHGCPSQPFDDPKKGYPNLLPSDPLMAAAYINNYHVARDANFHGTFNGAFSGTFNGSLNEGPTQNFGQQQQPAYPPNPADAPPLQQHYYAFDFNLPYDDVYKNFNNQTQLASYATKTQIPPTTTPATTPAPPTRALGDKVGEPIPLDLTVLVAGLLALPHVDASRKHPHRSDLKKPWENPVVYKTVTQSQRDIRDNFDSGSGYIKRASALLDWYGDESVFPMAFWDFLVRGEPRKNKKRGNQGEDERQDSEEIGGAKKQKKRQKKRQKMEEGDAAEAGVAGGDVGGAYVGGTYVGGKEVGEENVAVEDIAENVVAEKDVGGERVSEGGGEMGSVAPKRQIDVMTGRSSVCEDIVRGYTPEGETREQKAVRYRDQLKAADARRMADSMAKQGYNVQHLSANPEEGQAGPGSGSGSGVGAGSSDTDAPFLSGVPCNEFGELLKDSGDIAGELVAGDATKLSKSSLTADAKGRFINGKGKTVGRSKAFPQVEGEKKVEEEENSDAPLSILTGLPCNKAGKLIDLHGKIVGVLFEGDAESIAKSGITASNKGQFWGDKGRLLGRARTVGLGTKLRAGMEKRTNQ
jgi:hypothetical protein